MGNKKSKSKTKTISYIAPDCIIKNIKNHKLLLHDDPFNIQVIAALYQFSINNPIIYNSITSMSFCNLQPIIDNNVIQDINPLIYINFTNIRMLDLSQNKIIGINPLSKCNFNNLQQLWLNSNLINDLSPLSIMDSPKLKILNLNNNAICTLEPMIRTKYHFRELRQLYVNYNNIAFIDYLKHLQYPIRNINIQNNKITDLSCLICMNLNGVHKINVKNNRHLQESNQYCRINCLEY